MRDKINEILERMDGLEKEYGDALRKRQDELLYTMRENRARFTEEVRQRHKELATRVSDYVYESGILLVLTIPIIWAPLVPALVMDAIISVYQVICLPIYGIPRVRRRDYIVIDRHELKYLNWIEKLNCVYCGYFNGLMGYAREIAARTEQYWCPVRHSRPPKSIHSRYKHFFDYGDAEGYRNGLESIRKRFKDVRKR